MKMILAGLLLFALCLCLNAVAVAWVDGESIDGAAYQQEMELLPDSLDIMEKRQIALDNLIERKLLTQFADEQNIEVSEDEVEAFFIKQFWDHPLFSTEGEFDYAKFYELKDTERITLIFDTMREDILIDKTRELLNRQSQLTENELLERYILENVSLDINYAMFHLDDVSISKQLTAEGARQYWRIHKDEYTLKPQFKMGFTVIPQQDFLEAARVFADTIPELIAPQIIMPAQADSDSVFTDSFYEDLEQERLGLRKKEIDRISWELAKEKADFVKENLQRNIPISYPKLTTGFLSSEAKAGMIPQSVLESVQLMTPREFSEPYKLDNGYLIYWLIEYRDQAEIDLASVKEDVWDSYVKDQSFYSQEGEFQRYFFDHLEEFKVPAIQIYRIELFQNKYGREWALGRKRDKIIAELEKYMFNLDYMSSVARDNNLNVERRVIYLKRYHFKDEIDKMIANAVDDGETYGIIEENGLEYFYVLENFIPSYIPSFQDLNISDYYGVEVENRFTEEHYREYYNSHKRDFDSPDSVSVAGVHYHLNPDSVYVDSLEISTYYEENYNRFYHDDAVECRFILCSDWERAKLARNYLSSGYNHDLVSWAFSDKKYHISDGVVEYKMLPKRLAGLLEGSRDSSYLYPVETEEGWLIINKITDHKNGYYDLKTVGDQIRHKIAEYRADSLSYSYTRTVFDSTTYYSDCFRYADKNAIFETELQDINLPYKEIGDISDYKTALLRLWRNEKLTRIIDTDDGYAVLFMRRKVIAKERSFEEALPQIKAIFTADEQLKLGKEYIQGIIHDIQKGNNPDSLLFFHDGYNHIPNLSLTSEIPQIENSNILIEDMLKHGEGYFSPVFKLNSNMLMFYHINSVKKVTRKDFQKVKREYAEKIKKMEYLKWLEDYKQKKGVKIQF